VSPRTLVGRLSRTRFGYGFVRLETEGEDLFIPPHAMGGSIHGDRVRAGFLESRGEGDAHEIVEVLARTGYGIVGRYEGRGRSAVLYPERPEYPREIELTLHAAKRIPSGTRVVVRLRPTPADPLVGTIVATFSEDDPAEDSLLVALEEGIETEFDPEAEREAAAFTEGSVGHAARARADFRSGLTLTIAPDDAKYLQEFAWKVYQREIKNTKPAK